MATQKPALPCLGAMVEYDSKATNASTPRCFAIATPRCFVFRAKIDREPTPSSSTAAGGEAKQQRAVSAAQTLVDLPRRKLKP